MDTLEILAQHCVAQMAPAREKKVRVKALAAFRAWVQANIHSPPRGLRAGTDALGGEYFAASELILQYLGSGDSALERDALSTCDLSELLAILISELGSPIGDRGAELSKAFTRALARDARAGGSESMANRLQPIIAQNKRIAEGRQKGARAPKASTPLQECVNEQIAGRRNASAEQIWRRLEKFTSTNAWEGADSEVYVDGDEIVVVNDNGTSRRIKRKSFDRYVANAKRALQ